LTEAEWDNYAGCKTARIILSGTTLHTPLIILA